MRLTLDDLVKHVRCSELQERLANCNAVLLQDIVEPINGRIDVRRAVDERVVQEVLAEPEVVNFILKRLPTEKRLRDKSPTDEAGDTSATHAPDCVMHDAMPDDGQESSSCSASGRKKSLSARPPPAKRPARRKARPDASSASIHSFVSAIDRPSVAAKPPGAIVVETVRMRLQGLEPAAPHCLPLPDLTGAAPPASAWLVRRTELQRAPSTWCDAREAPHETQLAKPHELPAHGFANRLLRWIDRYRSDVDLRQHIERCVLTPRIALRRITADGKWRGYHLRCCLPDEQQTPPSLHSIDELTSVAMLLTLGRRVAHASSSRACVEHVELDFKNDSLRAYADEVAATMGDDDDDDDDDTAWRPTPDEAVLWGLVGDVPFWDVADERPLADLWAYLAPAAHETATLRIAWNVADADGAHLHVHPPAHWFDALPTEGVRLVLVRCATGRFGTPTRLAADRCLPYAVAHVAPGTWMRVPSNVAEASRLLRSVRHLCALGEAMHDALLCGTLPRDDAARPLLVCDERRCAYAACVQNLMRAQRTGVELEVRACYYHAGASVDAHPHLSFACVELDPAEQRSVADWHAQLFVPQPDGADAPTVDFAKGTASLRQALLAHSASASAWASGERSVWLSGWAFDVVTHAVRHELHRRLTHQAHEVVVFLVSSPHEPRAPAKKTIDALDAELRLEAVVRVALLTPVDALPSTSFA